MFPLLWGSLNFQPLWGPVCVMPGWEWDCGLVQSSQSTVTWCPGRQFTDGTFYELREQLISHRTVSTSVLWSKSAGDHKVQHSHFRDENTEARGGKMTHCGPHIDCWTPGLVSFPWLYQVSWARWVVVHQRFVFPFYSVESCHANVLMHTGTIFLSPLVSTWVTWLSSEHGIWMEVIDVCQLWVLFTITSQAYILLVFLHLLTGRDCPERPGSNHMLMVEQFISFWVLECLLEAECFPMRGRNTICVALNHWGFMFICYSS